MSPAAKQGGRNPEARMQGGRNHAAQRGVVLIMVLVILAGLALMLAEFSRLLLTDHSASAVGRVALGAKPLLASGERLAAQVLLSNLADSDPDTLHEPWSKDFPDLLRELSGELEAAELSGEITDENGRFPLSAMFARGSREEALAKSHADIFTRLTARLLVLHGLAENEPLALLKAEPFTKAVLYWGGDFRAPENPEDREWYLEGTPARSYIPPRSRFLSADELLLVRWEDMEPEQARLVLLGAPGIPGLVDLVSVWSPGPMNVNTLHPLLLHALIPDPDQALEFARYVRRYRESPDNALEKDWYREAAVKAVRNSGLFPFDCVGVRSRCFRVSLTAAYGAAKAKSAGICRVSPGRLQWFSRVYQ